MSQILNINEKSELFSFTHSKSIVEKSVSPELENQIE